MVAEKIKKYQITLDKDNFYCGERVTGRLDLITTAPMECRGVRGITCLHVSIHIQTMSLHINKFSINPDVFSVVRLACHSHVSWTEGSR